MMKTITNEISRPLTSSQINSFPHDARMSWEAAHLSECVVYPGHPVVLACMVMDRYASLQEALAPKDQHGTPAALADQLIPGAGCAVYAALDFLSDVKAGRKNRAFQEAERYWRNWESNSGSSYRAQQGAAGRAQAEKLRPYFEDRIKVWGGAQAPVS